MHKKRRAQMSRGAFFCVLVTIGQYVFRHGFACIGGWKMV